MPKPPTLLQLLALFALFGCERDDFYSEATFTENVARAYAECDEGEIRFLAGKHGIQLAFDECGSNKFSAIDWSHDGQVLSFHLTHGSHLLDAETMRIENMPTETPIAGSAWIRPGLLALPLGPSESAGEEGPLRIAYYDRTARTLDYVELPLGYADPMDLQPAVESSDVIALSLVGSDGVRRPYQFDRNVQEVTRILPFLDGPVERFSLAPSADLVAWSSPETTELLRVSTGESLHVFNNVKRAIPHHEGRYVALELEGEPISLFDQRTWNEMSPEAQERELRRKEKWLETLPEWAPREARPPELHILDLAKNQRYQVTAFHGDHFEWYRARNYWSSFILWGIEGKQLHRNVAVTDIAERLRMLDKGEVPLGMALVTLEGTPIESPQATPDGPPQATPPPAEAAP